MSKRTDEDIQKPLKRRPKGARQHATAGPYSPVLEVDRRRLVVISGQVAVDLDGHLIGATIEEQKKAILHICAGYLANASCGLRVYSRHLPRGPWTLGALQRRLPGGYARAVTGAHSGASDPVAWVSGRDRNVGREGEGIVRGVR